MDDIPKLIQNVEACALSLKGTLDAAVTRVKGMQEAMLKCDADVAAKVAAAQEQISNLRADIQHLTQERRKAERELELVQKDIEKGKKQIASLKDEYRRTIDRILAPA
jgi:predicted  nucleic acid-binding Zn-ribbon protein